MKNSLLLRRIARGIIAEHEFVRKHMGKINRNMALSTDALAELGNATYEASKSMSEFAKALKAQE